MAAARSGRPAYSCRSATCGGTASASPASASAPPARKRHRLSRPPGGGGLGWGGDPATGGAPLPTAVPASSQNAAVAGAQSKLTSAHARYAAAAPASPATREVRRSRQTPSHQAENSQAQ